MPHLRIVRHLELRRPWSQAIAEPVLGAVQQWLLKRASAQAEPVSVAWRATPAWARVTVRARVQLSLSVLERWPWVRYHLLPCTARHTLFQ